MARPSVLSLEDKYRLICAVALGEISVAEAARRAKVSEQSISNWKRQFLEGAKQGLADGGRPGSNPQVQRLESEIEDLKAALGEAHVELRVWKKSAEGRLGPTRSSK
jgi:transposase